MMDVLQVLLRAGHPQQGGRAAVGVPVRRRAQRHRGDRLQQLLMLPLHLLVAKCHVVLTLLAFLALCPEKEDVS